MEPFDGANKRLLEHALNSIAKKFHRRVIVSTDQGWALDYVEDMRVKGMPSSSEISENRGSYKDILLDISSKMHMDPDDEFVMLSLEYPARTYRNIRSAIQHYRKNPYAKSLLCRRPSSSVPQKFLVEGEEEGTGEPVIEDVGQEWREDEFDEGFVHSHFISITEVSELPEVNDWLWNEDTIFFPIDTDLERVRTRDELTTFEDE